MPETFYISEVSWSKFKVDAFAQGEALGLPDYRMGSVSRYVETMYPVWVDGHLHIKDNSVQLDDRSYQMWLKVFSGRVPRELSLSADCVYALSEWALQERIWRKRGRISRVGMAGSALELIGRGWWRGR